MQAAGGVNAVEAGHAHVHHHHVGLQGVHQRFHLGAVAGLAHHLHAGRMGQHGPQRFTKHGVVVHQQHPDGHGCSLVGASTAARPSSSSGTDRVTTVPLPGVLTTLMLPPR